MTEQQQRGAPRRLSYRDAGVDIDAGGALVERIGPAVARTARPELLRGLGGFAALATLPGKYREPVLVAGTDGVGTKLRLAINHGRLHAVGQDLVAMCVNDVLVHGAEPLLFLDYFATGALDVDVAAEVIEGVASGCELAGCALAGGETAEMPGFYPPGDFDLAGFCVGVVEREEIVDGTDIEPGDVLIGLPSSGPHANGYSLVRRILADQAAPPGGALLDALLAPTRIYVAAVQPALPYAKGMCHITGGGLVENLPRMFDGALAADVDLNAWSWPDTFAFLQQAGNVDRMEMLRTFNVGIGFVLCVAAEHEAASVSALRRAGERPLAIGRIRTADSAPAAGHLLAAKAEAVLG